MKRTIMMIIGGLFLLGTTTAAQAVVLVPGDLNVAPTGAASPGGTFLTSISTPFSGTDIMGTVYYTGVLEQTVRQNATGVLFEYYFTNSATSSDAITQLASLDFSGYTVDADAESAGTQPPGTPSVNGMNRSNAGQGVVVTFGWLNNPVEPGQNSGSFWIQTNAEGYTNGTTQFLGGGIASVITMGPTALAAVPEPATVSLLGMGLMGLLGFRRKRLV